MDAEERIATIEAKYQNELQQKNEKILELQRELSSVTVEKELAEQTHSRLLAASQKQVHSLRKQLDRLVKIKVDEIAQATIEKLDIGKF